MNKAELVEKLAQKTGMSVRETRALVDAVFDPDPAIGLIAAELLQGGKVAIVSSRVGSMGDNGSGGLYGYRMSKAAVNMAPTVRRHASTSGSSLSWASCTPTPDERALMTNRTVVGSATSGSADTV